MTKQVKVLPASVKMAGERTFETTITTGAVDRERDVIDPAGWKLDHYQRNPVVMWSHDYTMPPIAKSLEIRRTATGLVSVDQFPPPGVYAFADQVHDLIAAGLIRAKSVGFIPIRQTWNAERKGWDIAEAELLEHSYVSVPANPDALVRARSKGLDRAALNQFFGTPRGSDVLLLPEGVSRADVALALHTGLGAAVRQEVHRQARALGLPADDAVLLVEDDRAAASGGPALIVAEPQEIGEALGGVVGRIVVREVGVAVNRLRGRVD